MKRNLLMVLAFTGTVMFSTSCKKKGCTDVNATNYEEKAKKDDGTCKYESSIAFYYTEATSNNLWNDGVTSLKFYVDDKLIGSSSVDTYWAKPTCSSLGPVNFSYDLGTEKSKTVSYKVIDDFDSTIVQGSETLQGGYCSIIEVQY